MNKDIKNELNDMRKRFSEKASILFVGQGKGIISYKAGLSSCKNIKTSVKHRE